MPFDLRIRLGGLILYVVDPSRKRIAVFMPDCRARAGVSPTQPDNDTGAPHIGYVRFDLRSAGVTVGAPTPAVPEAGSATDPLPKPEYECVRLFNNETLDLHLPAGDAIQGLATPEQIAADPKGDPDDELLVPKVGQFADRLRLNDDLFGPNPRGLLMRTVLKGGAIDSRNSGISCEVDTTLNTHGGEYKRQFANSLVWTRPMKGSSLTMEFKPLDGSPSARIRLKPVKDGDRDVIDLKISNLCSDNPLEWNDFGEAKMTHRDDKDFKWLYRLMHPDGTTYAAALDGRPLPVPVVQQEHPSGDLILCYSTSAMGPVAANPF